MPGSLFYDGTASTGKKVSSGLEFLNQDIFPFTLSELVAQDGWIVLFGKEASRVERAPYVYVRANKHSVFYSPAELKLYDHRLLSTYGQHRGRDHSRNNTKAILQIRHGLDVVGHTKNAVVDLASSCSSDDLLQVKE